MSYQKGIGRTRSCLHFGVYRLTEHSHQVHIVWSWDLVRFARSVALYLFTDRALPLSMFCPHTVWSWDTVRFPGSHFVSLHWQSALTTHVLSIHGVILRFCAISTRSFYVYTLAKLSHYIHIYPHTVWSCDLVRMLSPCLYLSTNSMIWGNRSYDVGHSPQIVWSCNVVRSLLPCPYQSTYSVILISCMFPHSHYISTHWCGSNLLEHL